MLVKFMGAFKKLNKSIVLIEFLNIFHGFELLKGNIFHN